MNESQKTVPYHINHELQKQIEVLRIRLLALEKDFHDYKESQVGRTVTTNRDT